MHVPWPLFRKAYEKYPRCQALALWVEAILTGRDDVPPWLVDDLRKLCPGFIEGGTNSRKPKVTGRRLLEWAHNHEFGSAKRQGSLDALTFYGVRHVRSECAWAYWEQFAKDWNRKQSERHPSFDEWWHSALREELFNGTSHFEVAKAVETYIDWNALLLWLRPLFRDTVMLPRHVASELERRCPGMLGTQNSGTLQRSQGKSKIWQRFIAWGRDHCLSEPKQAGWLESFLQRVRFHPWQDAQCAIRLVS